MTTRVIDIDQLPPDERLRLIGDLWESLRATPEAVPVTPAQLAELDRRLDGAERGAGDTSSWEEIARQLGHRPA